MAYLFVKDYEVELMELNSDLSHMFIESHNYSNDGYLTSDTEARDIKKVESELQLISRKSFAGAYVCVPMHPLTKELTNIEKYSPKLAGYLEKRLVSIGITF